MQTDDQLELTLRPLTESDFAPYGDVVEAPSTPGRAYFNSIGSLRPAASPKLWMLTKAPTLSLPLRVDVLERHEFSSQAFVPIDVSRWIVVVAPGVGNRPDREAAVAFMARADQAICFRAGTWHAPLCVLDRVSRLVVSMWLDDTAADEEMVKISPIVVGEPQA